MLKHLLVCLAALSALLVSPVWAADYNYISAEQLRDKIKANEPLTILDIQYEGAYKAGHFPAAIATYAYPVKDAESKARIDQHLIEFKDAQGPVIVISRRGGGGSMRAFNYLKQKGIDGSRLFILQNGMQSWPYPEMVEVVED